MGKRRSLEALRRAEEVKRAGKEGAKWGKAAGTAAGGGDPDPVEMEIGEGKLEQPEFELGEGKLEPIELEFDLRKKKVARKKRKDSRLKRLTSSGSIQKIYESSGLSAMKKKAAKKLLKRR